MKRDRHKRKNNQVIIVTSDAVDARVKQYKIRPYLLRGVTLVACVLIGALIGYFIFEKDIWTERLEQTAEQKEAVKAIEQEKAELENKITELNGVIAGLNDDIADLTEQIIWRRSRRESPCAFSLQRWIPWWWRLQRGQ